MTWPLTIKVYIPRHAAIAARSSHYGPAEIPITDADLAALDEGELSALEVLCSWHTPQKVDAATFIALRSGPLADIVRGEATMAQAMRDWLALPAPAALHDRSATQDWRNFDAPQAAGPAYAELRALVEQTVNARRAAHREATHRATVSTVESSLRNWLAADARTIDGCSLTDAPRDVIADCDREIVQRAEAILESMHAAREAEAAAKQAAWRVENDARAAREATHAAAVLAWVERYGSEALRRNVADEHGCERTYIRERIALEWPGWTDISTICGECGDPSNITAASYAAYDAIVAKARAKPAQAPHAGSLRLSWLSVSDAHIRGCEQHYGETGDRLCAGGRLVAAVTVDDIDAGLVLVRNIHADD